MNQLRTIIYAFTVVVGASLAASSDLAWADAKTDKDIEERFKAADKDHDGKLTLAEAKAGMPRIAKGFDKIDKDKKGYLTVEQIKAFAASQ